MLKHTTASRAHTQDRSSGFTLVELLVVIVILGILAGVAVLAVSGLTKKGDDSACKAERKSVSTAIEAHYAEKGTYAASTTDLATANFLDGPTKYFEVNAAKNGVTTKASVTLPAGC